MPNGTWKALGKIVSPASLQLLRQDLGRQKVGGEGGPAGRCTDGTGLASTTGLASRPRPCPAWGSAMPTMGQPPPRADAAARSTHRLRAVSCS